VQPTPRHRACERDFRRIITDGDLVQPDEVEYTPASLIFKWTEQKLAVVVDLDDPEEEVIPWKSAQV
jgi:hypothetical protein